MVTILLPYESLQAALWCTLTLKDGVSFRYGAYVLRISGYSGFSRNLPTNTTTVLRGL